MKILFIVVTLVIVTAIAFIGFGRERSWRILFGNPDLGTLDLINIKRTTKPHDALLCSPDTCTSGAEISATLPVYNVSASDIIIMIDKAFQESGLIYERVDDRSNPLEARYVTRTSLMRYPDTNQFLAIENADGTSSLIAYARAQIGYSDAGNNLKRLKAITANLPH